MRSAEFTYCRRITEGTGAMSRVLRNPLQAVLLLAAGLSVSGCATTGFDSKPEAKLLFEWVPSQEVFISEVHACREADTVSVYGKVKRTAASCCNALRGHIDIVVIGPDGSVLDTPSLLYSPRNIPKVRTRSARFAARLPYNLPAGTTLRMAYHDEGDLVEVGTNAFVCRHSAAIADIEG